MIKINIFFFTTVYCRDTEELSAFVNYLTERDRDYPSWSKVENLLIVNPEPYLQAYLEYKAKK